MKKVVGSLAVFTLLATSVPTVNADTVDTSGYAKPEVLDNIGLLQKRLGIDTSDRLDKRLYSEIGERLGMRAGYVESIMDIIGKVEYIDKSPNLYVDIAVPVDGKSYRLREDVEIEEAYWVDTSNIGISRPNGLFIPDVLYTESKNIGNLMEKWGKLSRGREVYESLRDTVKSRILFYKAVLDYIGEPVENLENLEDTYIKIIELGKGEWEKELKKFRNGEVLELLLNRDSSVVFGASKGDITERLREPYIYGVESLENLMMASMSLVGKVQYVWGGGHLGTAQYRGINPNWRLFSQLYESNNIRGSVQPSVSNCPIHGEHYGENGCLFNSEVVNSKEEYLGYLLHYYGGDTIESKNQLMNEMMNYGNIINSIKYGNSAHRLDGLDCSGYVSWVFSQVDKRYAYDSNARNFINYGTFRDVNDKQDIQSGDVIAWQSHIVINVGKVTDDVDLVIESSPNKVKFGVLHRNFSSQGDISLAVSIAKEANMILGNIDGSEYINTHNLDTIGYYSEKVKNGDGEYVSVRKFNLRVGRYLGIENETNGSNLKAVDVIQNVIDKMPNNYISGKYNIDGSLRESFVDKSHYFHY